MTKLANFEVTFELQGLKVHVKGDREIAPSIANNVGRHFASVLAPAGLIEAPKAVERQVIEAEIATPIRRKRKTFAKSNGAGSGNSPELPAWSHDPARWGLPKQTWKVHQKAAWLLYVVEQSTSRKDLTASEMADVFNGYFREFGPLRASNISRDIGKEDALFGSDDGRWFLKQAGKEAAEKLIAQTLNVTAA